MYSVSQASGSFANIDYTPKKAPRIFPVINPDTISITKLPTMLKPMPEANVPLKDRSYADTFISKTDLFFKNDNVINEFVTLFFDKERWEVTQTNPPKSEIYRKHNMYQKGTFIDVTY